MIPDDGHLCQNIFRSVVNECNIVYAVDFFSLKTVHILECFSPCCYPVTIYYLAFTEVLVEKMFKAYCVAFYHNFNDSPFLSLNKYSLIIPEKGSAHYTVS